MRKTIGLFIVAILMFVQVGILLAETRSFTLQASVPTAVGFATLATSVGISASSVATGSGVWTSMSPSATLLSFDVMSYNSTYGYWAPNHYFAVDVGTSDGSGSVTTVVTYAEGTNPNAATGGHGLGYKAFATFQKAYISGGTTLETPIAAHGKKKLYDLIGAGRTVTPAQVTGGWLRVYLGVVTDPALVTGSELFTNLDHSGIYDGMITFTATLS
jgi:hypothetical protein